MQITREDASSGISNPHSDLGRVYTLAEAKSTYFGNSWDAVLQSPFFGHTSRSGNGLYKPRVLKDALENGPPATERDQLFKTTLADLSRETPFCYRITSTWT